MSTGDQSSSNGFRSISLSVFGHRVCAFYRVVEEVCIFAAGGRGGIFQLSAKIKPVTYAGKINQNEHMLQRKQVKKIIVVVENFIKMNM